MTILREYREEDCEPLARIIHDVWSMAMYGEAAMPGSRAYLRHNIARSTFFRVAECNGQVVGCVGASFHGAPKLADERDESELESMEGGMALIEDLRVYKDACRKMMESSGRVPEDELVLLIVDGRFRGRHIGRTLFDCACDYLRGQGAETMAILTDTDCSTGFYDSIGAEIVGRSEMLWSGERLGLFVYSHRLRFRSRTFPRRAPRGPLRRCGTGTSSCTCRSAGSPMRASGAPCSARRPSCLRPRRGPRTC